MQLKCGVTEDCLESSGQKKELIKVSWKNFLSCLGAINLFFKVDQLFDAKHHHHNI